MAPYAIATTLNAPIRKSVTDAAANSHTAPDATQMPHDNFSVESGAALNSTAMHFLMKKKL